MAALVLVAVAVVAGAVIGWAGWAPPLWVAVALCGVGLAANLAAMRHGRMPVSPAVGLAGLAGLRRAHGHALAGSGWVPRWLGDNLVLHFGPAAGLAYSPGDVLLAAGVALAVAAAAIAQRAAPEGGIACR